jgi:ceramide glucosyltransferase
MTGPTLTLIDGCAVALGVVATAYMITVLIALRRARTARRARGRRVPPTTILKPLCGAELGLYERLRSFCEQRCSALQIICGVQDASDPALGVVRRLQREFPQLDLQVAACSAQHGTSAKVSNLLNMMPLARHEYLVIADSDVSVPPDYLERVIAPLLDETVGIVTCPYHGRPQPGMWSLLGSLFINEWFMPSVRVASMFGSRAFAFGATIALRRETLARIGGFAAIADQLPDDYRLGELTRGRGLRTVLSEVEVETGVCEATLRDLVRHELRWLRTIRTVQPCGYTLAGITFSLPAALVAAVLARGEVLTLALLAVTVAARLMIDSPPRKPYSALVQLWLVALNDLLAFALWCWGFTARQVHWRNVRYWVDRDGTAHPMP